MYQMLIWQFSDKHSIKIASNTIVKFFQYSNSKSVFLLFKAESDKRI